MESFYQSEFIEAGCDEAGRGCLAGPVFAASVILPADFFHPLLNDSKQVSERNRYELRTIIEKEAIAFGVSQIDNDEIDQINILKASFKAMHAAIEKLNPQPAVLLIDGNRFVPYKKIKYHCIIKGDSKFASIAAASILAKTYRDDWMLERHNEFPHFNWNKNKGYGTAEHRIAIEKFGMSKYHRKTFQFRKVQQELF